MSMSDNYSDVQLGGKDMSADRKYNQQGPSGEFGQGVGPMYGDSQVDAGAPGNPYGYGPDPQNRMFSNDKTESPIGQAAEARGQTDTANDLINFLNNSAYTPGSRVCHELNEPQTPAHPAGKNDGRTGPA